MKIHTENKVKEITTNLSDILSTVEHELNMSVDHNDIQTKLLRECIPHIKSENILSLFSRDIIKLLGENISIEQLKYLASLSKPNCNSVENYIINNITNNRVYLEFCYSQPHLKKTINGILELYLAHGDTWSEYTMYPLSEINKEFFINNSDLFDQELISKLK